MQGFYSSFKITQGRLSLNVDVSSAMIIQSGLIVFFLLANQNARKPGSLDWNKAK